MLLSGLRESEQHQDKDADVIVECTVRLKRNQEMPCFLVASNTLIRLLLMVVFGQTSDGSISSKFMAI